MSRYPVYQDPHHPEEPALQGIKGSTFLESGYVYAPYVPVQVTGIINPVYKTLKRAGLRVRKIEFGFPDFKPRKGLMSRYDSKFKEEYYGVIGVITIEPK